MSFMQILKITALIFITLIAISALIYAVKKPEKNRNWAFDHAHSALIEFNEDDVVIHNFRNMRWNNNKIESLSNQDPKDFSSKKFQLSDIQSVKAVVSHFAVMSEIAHIFILFELKDKSNIGLSVEAKKEQGEEYSLHGGLFAKFELSYVFATYDDLVGVRLKRDEEVYIYPIKASAIEAQNLFRVAAGRANSINQTPELYHLFLKNCTTEIVKLVNQISNYNFPRLVQSFMPGDAGKALYKMGLIESDASSFEAIQQESLVKD